MRNEIPAGTKVGVLVTKKGVTSVQVAEVLAHMDGLVHVDLDGEAVSVDPSQIVPPDAPAPSAESGPAVLDPADAHAKIDALAEEITQKVIAVLKPLEDRVAALESQVADIQNRLTAAAAEAPAPAPAADPAPAAAETETENTQGSTAAVASGDAAAGS